MKVIIASIFILSLFFDFAVAENNLEISTLDIVENTISISLRFSLEEQKKIYNWRGHIYPLLDHGLFVFAKQQDGKKLLIKRNALILPVTPHESDNSLGKDVKFSEPLVLDVFQSDGMPYFGCLNMYIVYDTSKLSNLNNLSVLTLHSNTVSMCTQDDRLSESK